MRFGSKLLIYVVVILKKQLKAGTDYDDKKAMKKNLCCDISSIYIDGASRPPRGKMEKEQSTWYK